MHVALLILADGWHAPIILAIGVRGKKIPNGTSHVFCNSKNRIESERACTQDIARMREGESENQASGEGEKLREGEKEKHRGRKRKRKRR